MKRMSKLQTGLTLVLLLGVAAPLLAQPVIEDITFSSQPGSKFEVRLDFSEAPPSDYSAYTIEEPARIAIDFPGTKSGLDQKRFSLPFGNATGVLVLEAGDKTRLVLNLIKLVPYEAVISGNQLVLQVGQDSSGGYTKATPPSNVLESQMEPVVEARSQLTDLQFRRAESGEGRLILQLSDPSVDVNVFSEGGKINLEFLATTVPGGLLRRFDVTDFATPVNSIEVTTTERGTRLLLEAEGTYDYLAYQTGKEYILSVKPLSDDEKKARLNEFTYVGERISLNFQDIEVRAVLQLIADFTDLNLVASDTVSGNITLRLQNVPWDQALELVLRTKGLDSRRIGNVLMVAPAVEIAERERQEIESNKQIAELAPLQSEFIRIRYAKASEVVNLFEAGSEEGGSLVSDRGSVVVDERTNSIIITDTATKLAEIRDLIERVDVPIRQVMIEARIVIASTNLDEELGIEWGGGYIGVDSSNGNIYSASGSREQVVSFNQDTVAGVTPTLNYPVQGGQQQQGGNQGGDGQQQQQGLGAALVDLGVSQATSGFAVGFTSNDLFLTAELSALESSGQGEVVSQPKIITGDKQLATIKSGSEIPYQEGAASGATTVSFKEAVLKLEVTPNITPDDRILLDLVVNQDSLGDLVPSGTGGLIPTINTTQLTTQVLVGNGETVVLGGVFQNDEITQIRKVPFLGDIPYLGTLFKNTASKTSKTETLIFITPRILSEALLD
ncbi:MAG: type IV pilus secretin PilQ [Luminiphilus sp.]|jgi:type IV pilus assembly protein PilQ|nr:type IV pilus secretin PilQ [Luminiphilus sp.]MDG2137827.1 type IV pilus secretin PilQ [Luminiphilus sp.]